MNRIDTGIKTDYSPIKTLFLAYPEDVMDGETNYSSLTSFYDSLINLIPKKIQIQLFVKRREIGERVIKMRKNTNYIVNAELNSIWLRDIIGFVKGQSILKPIFKPKYYWGAFAEAEHINQNIKIIHSLLNYDLINIPLRWDGGNLVTNGTIGFITKRLLVDNKQTHKEEDIIKLIEGSLEIEPVFIPEMSNDEYAHADGYINFLDDNMVAICDYENKKDKVEKNYLKNLHNIALDYGLNIVPIKELDSTEKMEGKYIPKGNYVNFLRLNKYILMPTFDIEELDQHNGEVLNKYGKVIKVNCNELVPFGGLLHCISWSI